MAADRPGNSSVNAGQPAPSATPAVSGVGVIPTTAPSGAPGAVASSPGAKPVVPGAPYLGRHDLAGEDKIRFFDRIAELVSCYLLACVVFVIGGTAVLPMGVAPEAASKHLQLVVVFFLVYLSTRFLFVVGVPTL